MEINVLTGTLLETNNYIITSENKAVIIESSCNLNAVKELVCEREVCGILLTHGHWDHYINIEKFAEEFKCNIFMTQEANVKINKKEKAFYADRNPKVDLSAYSVNYIKEGDILNFGDGLTFKVLETPGHTNCSVCYILNVIEETIIFSGDTIFNNGVGRADLPSSSHEDLNKSIAKLLKYDDKTVILPGHGDPTILKLERDNLLKLL